MPIVHDCVVVGAGAAGLLAVVTLKEAGRDVIVLEARDEIGGRARSTTLSGGAVVERGARNVHGPTVATWEFIARLGLKTNAVTPPWVGTAPTFRDGKWLSGGDPVDNEAFEHLEEALGKPNPDSISLREALINAGLKGAHLSAAELMLSGLVPMAPEELSAKSASDIWHVHDSNRDPIGGVSRPGNPNFQIVGGYSRLWRELSRPIDTVVHLSTPVSGIDWSAGGVVVHGNGSEFRARSAILTLPVGVLQEGTVEFHPPLPELKLAAVRGIRSGGTVRVIAEFGRPWWENTIGRVPFFRSAPPSPFRTFVALLAHGQGPPALAAGIAYPHAEKLSGDVERVRSLFLDVLGEMFPQIDLESELVSLEVVDWASDPWTMGTQSCVPVGGHQLRADLAAPTPPLFWAGEATHTRGLAACVHGALETGRRSALEVLHTLQPLYESDPESRLDWWRYNEAMR